MMLVKKFTMSTISHGTSKITIRKPMWRTYFTTSELK